MMYTRLNVAEIDRPVNLYTKSVIWRISRNNICEGLSSAQTVVEMSQYKAGNEELKTEMQSRHKEEPGR
jgi:hypothetical protein